MCSELLKGIGVFKSRYGNVKFDSNIHEIGSLEMKIIKSYLNFLILSSLLMLNGCAEVDTKSSEDNDGGGSSCEPGNIAQGTYNVSWDTIDDPDGAITSYKVYYSLDQNPVTSSNADGNFILNASNASPYSFKPGDYLISSCINVNFAVVSTNGIKDSDISETISILIE